MDILDDEKVSGRIWDDDGNQIFSESITNKSCIYENLGRQWILYQYWEDEMYPESHLIYDDVNQTLKSYCKRGNSDASLGIDIKHYWEGKDSILDPSCEEIGKEIAREDIDD